MKRACLLGMSGILVFLLTGCGDDRPVSDPPPGPVANQYPAPAPAAPAPAAQTPDPLLAGDGAMSSSDPLLHGSSQDQTASSTSSDPLLQHDPLQGPAMPTEHSHWLRGQVRDARLTVLLNGVRQGAYSGMVDQDITMKLHPGINSVTFLYAPRRADSSAQLDLLESEHDPPIPPLASFQSAPAPSDAAGPPTISQSFTFFAK
jgi:hypothetical protein